MIATSDAARVESDADEVRSVLRSMAAAGTLETSTRTLAEIQGYSGIVREGSEVFVAWVPGVPCQHLVSVSKALRQKGFIPVPHIVARRLVSQEQAHDLLSELVIQAGVDRALLVGGDETSTRGPFPTTLSLLGSGLLDWSRMRRVYVGGFPEGHPRVGDDRVFEALRKRVEFARDRGIDLRVVSQFCFDAGAIYDWVAALRSRGIDVPVRIGLAGPASLRTLLRFATACGIGTSARVLRGHALALTRLAVHQGPEQVACRLGQRLSAAPVQGVEGFHLFSFGGVAASARWLHAVAKGDFRVEGDSLSIAG